MTVISKVCKEQQLLEQLEGEDLLDQSESEADDKTVVMETSDLEDDTVDGGTDKSEMVEVPPVVSKALTQTKILTGANTIPVGSSVADSGRRANAEVMTSANPNTRQVGVGRVGSVPPLLPSPNTGQVVARDDTSSSTVQKHPLARDGTYLAINLYRRAASSALNLLGGAPCIPPQHHGKLLPEHYEMPVLQGELQGAEEEGGTLWCCPTSTSRQHCRRLGRTTSA